MLAVAFTAWRNRSGGIKSDAARKLIEFSSSPLQQIIQVFQILEVIF